MRKFSLTSALAFFIATMIFQGCSNDEVSDTPTHSTPKSFSTAYNTEVKFTEGGNLQAILHADSLVDRGKNTYAWNIKVDFFADRDTIYDGKMTADSGFVVKSKGVRRQRVSVFGDVHLIAPDGTELYSDSLRWNPKTQQIESGSKVKIVRGKEVIHGTGFKSDPNFEHIKIIDVSGKIEG